ncbi:MAG: GAF domain-containing protein [Gemmatimonadota bacterium]|nr:GAF domain-containing protein [Gemmatimonadota bacterium]
MGDRGLYADDIPATFERCPFNRPTAAAMARPVTDNAEGLRRQIEALQERVSRLSAAALRVSDSLDLDAVLREVVDSARALTAARYGMVATVDHTGGVAEFVASGFTPDEDREIAAWPDSPRLFEHFRDLAAPLRLADLQAYVRSLGLSSDLIWPTAMLVAPMKYRGVDVGSFFLAEKEGGEEFTSADEEVLVLFASQAATALANTRAHREERRARADLEALVETSPVGVVVFDAETGKPLSSNREARRIVEGLSSPGRAAEELLEVMTCRRADGREVSLAEFPLARQLSDGETVRAEEMTLSVPDGRSVTTLVNVTPIQAAENEVRSVVVTMQDLAPFEELERMRTEFLAIVSHELRAPLTSIKGSTATVLGASPGFATPELLQFFRIIDAQADQNERPHRRSAGCRTHRHGYTVGLDRILGRGNARGSGEEHLPERRRPAPGSRRPSRGTASRVGGSATHRAGAEQPPCQCRQALSGVVAHPGFRAARRRSRCDLGRRQRPGHSAGAPPAPVPEARRHQGYQAESGGWSGPGHLQGTRRGSRRAHLGQERWRGPGRRVHVHGPVG